MGRPALRGKRPGATLTPPLPFPTVFGKWGLGNFGTTGYPLSQGFDTFIGQDSQVACHNWCAMSAALALMRFPLRYLACAHPELCPTGTPL